MRHELRNKKRGIAESEARELLERGEYGILSTCDADGQPYGIPLSYCVIDNAIYFHCAVEGHKLENLAANNKVSFCVVGKTEVLPDQFATRFESVVVSGKAAEVFDKEKQLGLEGLLPKYSAEFVAEGLNYIDAAREQTRVFRISIDNITGKARR
ncbi:MAG: pyridoxamine 5'-phosphate oxidase family protein [Geobacteraceae bacterium]|nr:pyridoxamine 5'-phosphate oxidase family protein [Geobacteraceae bacterium]NTW79957.1 pyridoxamine 5'-phosphate oxidase family protein [Geobacteraceae bacterium]